jgi:glycosyltransferase involved in cell wall biosynthesis
MRLSYAVLVHNEGDSLAKLLAAIRKPARAFAWEIVLVDDFSTDPRTCEILSAEQLAGTKVFKRALADDFAAQKNFLNEQCGGDYIFNLDADELPPLRLVAQADVYCRREPQVDVFELPRLNTIADASDADLSAWGKTRNALHHIDWPDWQQRLYRRVPSIRWQGRVHEKLSGYGSIMRFPAEPGFAIVHSKTRAQQMIAQAKYLKI